MDDPEPARARLNAVAALAVMAGGSVGVLLRGLLTLPVPPSELTVQVLLTAAINIVGSFLLGVFVAALRRRRPLVRAFAGTGVLGGFTTYSAFAVQTVDIARTTPILALTLVGASVAGGLVAAWAGLLAGRRGFRDGRIPLAPREAE